MCPDDDADMPHWGKFKRRNKPMTRVSRGRYYPNHDLPSFFVSPIQRAILQILSTACTSWARVTPSFTPVLLPSVPLLSKGGGGIGGRKVLPLVYITFTAATTLNHYHPQPLPLPSITATTSTSSWSSSIRNDEDSADLTKSFQELSRRLPVLVNSGHRLGSFSSLNRAGTPFPDYFEAFALSFFFFFSFSSISSQVWTVFLFLLFLFVCRLIIANSKMR